METYFPEETHARPYYPETIDDVETRVANGERITVGMAMELLGIESRGIDTALPQDWVNAVYAKTGQWAPGNIVWSYRPEHGSTIMGTPVAITRIGLEIIRAMYP